MEFCSHFYIAATVASSLMRANCLGHSGCNSLLVPDAAYVKCFAKHNL
jgi:hypothetical protein